MNLLIVDDDKRVVDSIIENLDWHRIGISRTLTANNVKRAIEVMQAYTVHILLTDIEMSQGSGLELLEWIKEQNLSVKCIVLSSYAKFSYAQKAIELNVCEYLLKPVRFQQLGETIQRVASAIPVADEDKKKDLFYKILKEPGEGAKYIQSGIEQKFIAKRTEYILLLLLRIHPKKYTEKNNGKNSEIWDFAIRNILKEFFDGKDIKLEAIIQKNDIEWYVVVKDSGSYEQVLGHLKDCFCKSVNENTFIYVCGPFPLQNIVERKEELDDMAMKYLPGNDNLLYMHKFRETDWENIQVPWDKWITDAYGMENFQNISEMMKSFLGEANEKAYIPVKWLRQFRNKLVWLVYKLLGQYHMVFSHIFDNEEYDEYYDCAIYSVNHMTGFIDWMFTRMERNKENSTRKEQVVESIKEYIAEHLSDDLSRKRIAEVMFMSEDYVGKIFIAAVGKSISAYVMEQRMEAAQRDLEQKSLPVSQVAMRVGYYNFSYFSKSFKEYTGYTPNEYRSKFLLEKK